MSEEERNPWQTLSSRLVYKNPWISVREDQVIRPDGVPGIYGVVDTRLATGVVALTEQNEIYLVGQYRYTTECYSWEIIEGGRDNPNELPVETAQRELREEAGLIAREWSQLGGEFHISNCISSERCLLFLARGLSTTKSEPEGTEVLQIKKIPFSTALGMVDRGEIQDSVSIIGILRAARLGIR